MVTPRLAKNYPPSYADLFRKVLTKEQWLTFDTPKAAKRFRQHLYAYRTALLNDPSVAPDVALIASSIRFSISKRSLLLALSTSPTALAALYTQSGELF